MALFAITHMRLWMIILLALAGLGSGCGRATSPTPGPEKGMIEIQIYTNRETVYTNYRFAVTKDGEKMDWDLYDAKIEWDVIDLAGDPKPKKHLIVHQLPGAGSFSANAGIHKALMRKIFSRWSISDFDSVSFGCLGGPPDWSWSIAIAVASSKSDDYKDYKAHYPHSRITNLNGLFEKLANESKAFGPLQEAFREFGVDIEVGGVEKVIAARAEDLPFYSQLRAAGISGKTRVLYDALGNGFTIKPWQNKAGPTNGSQPFSSETNKHNKQLVPVADLTAASHAEGDTALGVRIVVAARQQVGVTKEYDPAYTVLKYPGGDVPLQTGVCCDVVVRALRQVGIDLQKEVHEDMQKNFSAYPQKWGLKGPDKNIDHRRVPNLMRYFERHQISVPEKLDQLVTYRSGDIVAWDLGSGVLHIGIVSDKTTGRPPLIIHNIGGGTKEENILFQYRVIGHYRVKEST
jgi:uncharacterized protein